MRTTQTLNIRPLPRIPNTLGLACAGNRTVSITDPAQLPALHALCAPLPHPPFVLGGASNVILPPHVDRLLLLSRLRGIELLDATPDAWIVQAMAGESWHGLVEHTLEQGWDGLENLALIPGTVGAAPVQNIGAYGVELRERVHSVLAWHLPEGRLHELSNADCRFAYRDSRFKREAAWMIVAVRLRLPRPWQAVLTYPDVRRHVAQPASARAIFDAVCTARRAKLPDPGSLGNVGSYFKNPVVDAQHAARLLREYPRLPAWPQADGRVKLAGGWLIEAAGWKGRRLGATSMHAQQALVLVNHGQASIEDVLALEYAVQRSVRARFDIVLEREPVLLHPDAQDQYNPAVISTR